MKTTNVTVLILAASLLTAAAIAETPTSSVPAQMAPSQIIYASQLPSVPELTKAAAAQGLTIKQIVQSARDLNVVYQSAEGQINTVVYQLLADAGSSPVQATAPAAVQVTTPTVVYTTPPVANYYYDPYYYPYYSGYFYPPVSVRLGGGFRGGRRW